MRAARKGEKPLVSVIMFVYNHAPYLKQAIESVLMQEGSFPAEILIHDDASSDGSAEIIRTYAKRFPDLIVPLLESENQTRQGINYVDHTIMPRLSGTYIAHCEGDDYWTDPKKLKKLIKINAKGVITFKKWKQPKKATYRIKVRITAKGNKNYYSKTVNKVVKIKV